MATHELGPIAAPHACLVSVTGRSYPLESARVSTRAEAGIAATTLEQRFANPYDEPLEVIYSLPLAADGAVLGYTIRVGERVIRGEVQPRERAEKAYREALYEGRTTGLLEQDRADTFRQRLGNLPPRTPVVVEIEVLQPLAFLGTLDGRVPQWEYRFPTVTGIRYEGSPGRVTDAERLDVDRAESGVPTRAELALVIADPLGAMAAIESPSHAIVRERHGDRTLVRFTQGERLDRDIVLRWDACAPEVGVRLVEGGGLAGDDGRYALVTLVPPAFPATAMRRDLTVLIDASGSMDGAPLGLAKRVVSDLLESLDPGDTFELLAFASRVRPLSNGREDATPAAIERTRAALARLEADGATEMLHAIEEALAPLRGDSQRQVVLVTDGYIGFESEVIGRIARQLPGGTRVHAVGIGAAPNRTLLQGVASAGRGVELGAGDERTAAEAGRRLCAATARPVLTEVLASGAAVKAAGRARPRDVCAGQPARFTLELDDRGGALELTGRLAGSGEPWHWRADVAPRGAAGRAVSPLPLGTLHGREVIEALELSRAANPQDRGIDARIEACAMRHRIVSRRTSLVAIAEEPSVDPNAPRRREQLAVEVPKDVSAEAAGVRGQRMIAALGAMMKGPIEGYAEDEATLAGPPAVARTPAEARQQRHLFELMKRKSAAALVPRFEVHSVTAELVRLEGELLVVEFETPCDGFFLPRHDAIVQPWGGMTGLMVDEESSGPAGPHAKGLRVRLALRLPHGGWPHDAELKIEVLGPSRSGSGSVASMALVVHVALPPQAPEPTGS